jgi:hypothetical protein
MQKPEYKKDRIGDDQKQPFGFGSGRKGGTKLGWVLGSIHFPAKGNRVKAGEVLGRTQNLSQPKEKNKLIN